MEKRHGNSLQNETTTTTTFDDVDDDDGTIQPNSTHRIEKKNRIVRLAISGLQEDELYIYSFNITMNKMHIYLERRP